MLYKQEIAKLTGQRNFNMVGGVPVDADNNPLLSDDKLKQLQTKHHIAVTEDPQQAIKAATRLRKEMEGVGGSNTQQMNTSTKGSVGKGPSGAVSRLNDL